MIHVYHYSEEPAITAFAPRPSRLGEPFVWAIDMEERLAQFFNVALAHPHPPSQVPRRRHQA